MPSFYRLAADVMVVVHLAFVAFVALGQVAILVGVVRGWPWVCGRKFRVLHLLAIAVVVVQSLLGTTCPLTIWEKQLRRLGGQEAYPGDFLARWAHDLLFFDAEPWVFTLIYTLFGLLVLLTFLFAPPVWRPGLKRSNSP
jgi:hypothetical protein